MSSSWDSSSFNNKKNNNNSNSDDINEEPHSYFTLRKPQQEDVPLSPRFNDPQDIEHGTTSYAGRHSTSASTSYPQYSTDYASTPYVPSLISAGAQGKQFSVENPYHADGYDAHGGQHDYRQPSAFSSTSRHRNQPELGRAGSEINLYRPEILDVNSVEEQHPNSASIGPAPNGFYLPTAAASDAASARQVYGDDTRAIGEPKLLQAPQATDVIAPPVEGREPKRNTPKVLLKPKVARQLAKRAAVSHRPYFTWIVSVVHVVLLLVGFVMNYTLTGNVIENFSRNPMVGPSSTVLINMGARFAPCMRTVPSITSTTLVPCPNCTDPTSPAQNVCTIDQLCGFGGFPANQPNQWFRFFIPIFLHGGILHLLFNLMFQWRTGMEMEKDMGTIRFGLIYMISGVVGFTFGANFAPLVSVSVGASGALFGLIGCLLLDLLQNWKLIVNPITELCKMLAVIILSFALGLLPGFDNFAHIGGFISGIVAGVILLPRINFGKWDRRVKFGSMLAAVPLLVVIFVFTLTNFYNTRRNPAAACPWCKYLSCLPVNGWCDAFDVSASQ